MNRAAEAAWRDFVFTHGWKARAHELAAVIGQPLDAVLRLRATGACSRLDKPKRFAELFGLWHGREPTEDEWPAPRKIGKAGSYEWLPPELALLASLVGRIGSAEIAQVLTARLREQTGDKKAERSKNSVVTKTGQVGLQSCDVVGGLTTAQAAREIGSLAIVNQMIAKGELQTRRVGRLHVIPHKAWQKWKAARVFPPDGYVRLSTLRQSLGIKSDKLSEYARMGLIPTAIRCNPYGTKGPSTQFGTWWISKATADKLLGDRRSGQPMPWHGVYDGNLRVTFKLWQKRKHPVECATCAGIWGKQGSPRNFSDYVARYPALAHGAKRHLTRPWSDGLTLAQVAAAAGCSEHRVRYAIKVGALPATKRGRTLYVTRTEATRWKARKCPTGDSEKSWIALDTAAKQYLFTRRELNRFIADGTLKHKVGIDGAMKGNTYVLRHQCARLRETIGFTEDEAARRLGITVARFRKLVAGVDWRRAKKIPLVTVQAVRKRIESRQGYTIEEAANILHQSEGWVMEQIDNGVARVSRAKWDLRRLYLTEPMLERLRQAAKRSVTAKKLGAEWLFLSEAAAEASVSLATVNNWGVTGQLSYREHMGRRRYHRKAVRAQARRYWQVQRRQRARPPEWLVAERHA